MQSCNCRFASNESVGDGIPFRGRFRLDTSECKYHRPLTDRIEELEKESTQRGARMQIMMEWMSHTDMTDPDVTDAFSWVADAFTFSYPESKDWFDSHGVPVREVK